MIYLIDSNTFIDAARMFYSFDYGTKFWDFLEEQARNQVLASIDKVYEEINQGNDALKNWINDNFIKYFLKTKEELIIQKYAELMQWAEKQNNHYRRNALDDFMKEENADPWLIAFANSNRGNYIVVTFEKYNQNQRNKIPIPNVCKVFNINYCDLFQMLKDLKFKL